VNVAPVDARLSRIAAAIGEPARTRMLCCLLDGHARTSTELAAVAEVTPSTASAHLARLKDERLVKILAQGKHRYYSLESAEVAEALETLMILAGGSRDRFVPGTPPRLRAARTCYDHMAGAMAVSLHDRLRDRRWIVCSAKDGDYEITEEGGSALERLGVDVRSARASRRRLAYPCVDWSERRPHVGGALGAALLALAVRRRWVDRDLDSRILTVTPAGRREMRARFGVEAGVREAPAGERSTSTT
jgi:DNA-binding transcriptional ArsR family regulator